MNTTSRNLITALGLSLLLAGQVAGAGPRHEGHNRFMNFFDNNSDGIVTHEEFQGASKDRFDRIDADKNAAISEEEFSTYMNNRREQRHKERVDRMDSNKDGQVSKDEFLAYSQQRAERRFARMDANNDGQLSENEMTMRKKHKHRFGKKIFSRIDANNDGIITRQESQEAWEKWFERMDENGDKVVTDDEVSQAREKWRGKWNG
ncbi:EF-hand domain-containing protein [Kaarinaea lacus]